MLVLLLRLPVLRRYNRGVQRNPSSPPHSFPPGVRCQPGTLCLDSLSPSVVRKQAASYNAKRLASKPQGNVYVEPLRPDTKSKVTGRMRRTLACVTA
jgi:hypothetical protein